MFNSSFNSINNTNSKEQKEATIMSNVDAVISKITGASKGLVLAGATAFALSLSFGGSAQAEEFKLSPEWRVYLEQDLDVGGPDLRVASPIHPALSSEWMAHLEAETFAGQSSPAYGVTEPSSLSPEWAAHLDAETLDEQARVSYAAAKFVKFSAEWVTLLETETLSGAVERSATALGQ